MLRRIFPREETTVKKTMLLALLLAGITILSAHAQAAHDAIPYDELPRLGPADAPVRIVEFSDFKCPHCKTFADQIMPLLRNEYISAGMVAFYYVTYPVVSQDSVTAAAAAVAVHDMYGNDAFWAFKKALFENQGNPREAWATPEYLASLAASAVDAVDEANLREAIEGGEYVEVVRRNAMLGRNLGVSGTPTVLVGDTFARNAGNYSEIRSLVEGAR